MYILLDPLWGRPKSHPWTLVLGRQNLGNLWNYRNSNCVALAIGNPIRFARRIMWEAKITSPGLWSFELEEILCFLAIYLELAGVKVDCENTGEQMSKFSEPKKNNLVIFFFFEWQNLLICSPGFSQSILERSTPMYIANFEWLEAWWFNLTF